VTSGWIIGENLRPFIEVLAWQAETRLADDQWETIRADLESTDEVEGRWAEFDLPGISLKFALMDRENEGTYISLQVAASTEIESVAGTLVAVMQAYRLREDR
jgi:hypothetical protein